VHPGECDLLATGQIEDQQAGMRERGADVGYFDGQAVPANGVLVVKIPKTVLTINGGTLGEDEVRQKVQKHMALGEYPIVEFV
jgi:hypothetical protein